MFAGHNISRVLALLLSVFNDAHFQYNLTKIDVLSYFLHVLMCLYRQMCSSTRLCLA